MAPLSFPTSVSNQSPDWLSLQSFSHNHHFLSNYPSSGLMTSFMYLRRSRLIAHTHPLPLAPPRHGLPYACLLDDIPKTLFYHTESLLKTSQWHPIAVTVSIGELQGSVNSLKYLNNFECIKFCVFFWGVKNYSLHQILKKKEYLF